MMVQARDNVEFIQFKRRWCRLQTMVQVKDDDAGYLQP